MKTTSTKTTTLKTKTHQHRQTDIAKIYQGPEIGKPIKLEKLVTFKKPALNPNHPDIPLYTVKIPKSN